MRLIHLGYQIYHEASKNKYKQSCALSETQQELNTKNKKEITMEGIIAACITGGLAFAGVIVSALLTARKTEATMRVNQAVTEEKITELTREVRLHNGFAEEIPLLKYQMEEMREEIRHLREYHEQ